MHILKKVCFIYVFVFIICLTGKCQQTMDSSNSQYRVRQCFHCEESTVFVCSTCERSLCGPCRTKHLHNLLTSHHETVVYRENIGKINIEEMCTVHHKLSCIFYCKTCKLPFCRICLMVHVRQLHTVLPIEWAYAEVKKTHSEIISSIKSEHLFYRRALLIEIQSDMKTLNTKMFSHKNLSKMLTKAHKLKQLIDKVVYERNKCELILQNQKKGSHIATIQRYEYKYEESAMKPTKFISFLKKNLSNIQFGLNFAQSSHLFLIESINVEDVKRFTCAFTLYDRGKRCVGHESLLELMPKPQLQQRLELTNASGCSHVSHVRPDRFWVSDNRTYLILFNANGTTQPLENKIHVYTDVYHLTGVHTVDKNNDLIYIDTKNQIKLLSNTDVNTLSVKDMENRWTYRCVYSSLLSGDLLVGMSNMDSTCSKITRYHLLEELVQTIQHDNRGNDLYVGPCYITENANGDVIVSDWKNGVVVTDNEGKHRFTFSEDPYGLVISPKGICTDPCRTYWSVFFIK